MAENQSISSLKNQLTQAEGLQRITILNQLARSLHNSETEEALTYAQQGWEETAQLLENSPDSRKLKSCLAESIFLNSACQWILGFYTDSIENGEKSRDLYEQLNDDLGQANALNVIANSLNSYGEPARALQVYQQSLLHAQKAGYIKGEANTLNNIGSIHWQLGNTTIALQCFQESLKLKKKLDDPAEEASALINIGVIYKIIDNPDKAIECYERGIALVRDLGDIRSEAGALNNLAIILSERNQDEEALEMFERALELSRQCHDKTGEANTLNSLLEIYKKNRWYNEALDLGNEGLTITREMGNIKLESNILLNMAQVMLETDQIHYSVDQVLDMLEEARTLAEKAHARQLCYSIYKCLSQVYESVNDLTQALYYHRRYSQAREALHSEETEKKLKNLANAFELEQARQETELQRIKNVELVSLNRQVTAQKDEVEAANAKLKKLNKDKNELLGMLTHGIRTPVGSILNLAELIRDLAEETDEELSEYAGSIKGTCQKLIQMLKNVTDWNTIDAGQMKFQIRQIDLIPIIRGVASDYLEKAWQTKVELVLETNESQLLVYSDEIAVIRIIDNLLSNAVKFSPHHSEISIRASYHDDYGRIEVVDNGPGISEEEQKKLFLRFVRLSAKPTDGEYSSGLGLSIVKKMADSVKAQVTCDSEMGKGSIFSVDFPIRPVRVDQ